MTTDRLRFQTPPNWPQPPKSWVPSNGWKPDVRWGEAPKGWRFWVSDDGSQVSDEVAYSIERLDDIKAVQATAGTAQAMEPLRNSRSTIDQENEPRSSNSGSSDLIDFDSQRELQALGIYEYNHPLDDVPSYKERIDDLQNRIKMSAKNGDAISYSEYFAFNGSYREGQQLSRDLGRLMLRAYNAEAENCISRMRNGNFKSATNRLQASVLSIERFGKMLGLNISKEYHALRVDEIKLVADYQMKKREEKELARAERERLREERAALLELKSEMERLEKERAHYENVLDQLVKNESFDEAEGIRQKIEELEKSIEFNNYRLSNIRAGYVYVISNPGSFGSSVVKIGLTRRLEPAVRIRELSGASVPFRYEIHALFFSDDAVSLETDLHHEFDRFRVNAVNRRREFFFVEPHVVREALLKKVGHLLEFHEKAESIEYFQSVGKWIDKPIGPAVRSESNEYDSEEDFEAELDSEFEIDSDDGYEIQE